MHTPTPHAFAGALLALLAGTAAGQTLSVTEIGPGHPSGLSADGSTAVGRFDDTGETWRWQAASGQVGLGRFSHNPRQPGHGTPAVSADGSVVAATILNKDHTHGVQGRWTAATGWRELGPPPRNVGHKRADTSEVYGISRDGNVVVGLYYRTHSKGIVGETAKASVWSPGKPMRNPPGYFMESRAVDANGDGHILVGSSAGGYATVWVRNEYSYLPSMDAPQWGSEATKVNTHGTVIAGHSVSALSGANEATLWRRSETATWTTTWLGLFPEYSGSSSRALALSDDASVVTGIANSHGFVWTAATGMVTAETWLLQHGVDVRGQLKIDSVPGLSADGLTMLAGAQRLVPPFDHIAIVIRPVGAAVALSE